MDLKALGFTKIADSKSMLAKKEPSTPDNYTKTINRINSLLMTKKDNPPVWEKPVVSLMKDVDKYKRSHGTVKNYLKSRVQEARTTFEKNPKASATALIGLPAANFAARNNPKFRQAIEAITSRKISYHKKGKKPGHRTSFQYNFPKGKGDWGKLQITKRF